MTAPSSSTDRPIPTEKVGRAARTVGTAEAGNGHREGRHCPQFFDKIALMTSGETDSQ